jgi:NADH-quinone oxidoreductase subunit L
MEALSMLGPLIHLTWASPMIGAVIALFLSRRNERAGGIVSAISLFIPALLSSILAYEVFSTGQIITEPSYTWISLDGIIELRAGLFVDGLSSIMALVVSWLSFLIGVYSIEYLHKDKGIHRYWFFFNYFVGSMMLLVLAQNLLLFLVGWEGTTLSSYALIGHWYRDEDDKCVGDKDRRALGRSMWFTPSHSGVRAVVITGLADIGLILGIGLLLYMGIKYQIPDALSIPGLYHNAGHILTLLSKEGLLLPFIFIFTLGAFGKSAQFPFHEWLVTAMTGPTSVSALIHAATMVKAGVYFLLRFAPIILMASISVGLSGPVSTFFIYTAMIGAFTAFMMATQAVVAKELKLILAFSTASQLGYMFLAIGSMGLLEEPLMAFSAGFSHLINHAVFKATLFLAAGALIHTYHSKYITEMGGAAKYMKLTFIAFVFAALSLSGIPPFSGFWSKDSIIEASYEAGLTIPFLLSVVTALLTAIYTFRAVTMVFTGGPKGHGKHVHEAHPLMLLPYLATGIGALLIGVLWPFISPYITEGLAHITLLEIEVPHPEFNLVLTSISVLISMAGVATAVLIYTRTTPYEYIKGSATLRGLHNFLYDRWYINSVYYLTILDGFRHLSNIAGKWFDYFIIDNLYHKAIPAITIASVKVSSIFEYMGVDRLYHTTIPTIFNSFSMSVRRIQTGNLSKYLTVMLIGLSIMFVAYMVFLRW